jgi:hypothetical protein
MKRYLIPMLACAALVLGQASYLQAKGKDKGREKRQHSEAADCASSLQVDSAFRYSEDCAQASITLKSSGPACVDIEARRGSTVLSLLSSYSFNGSATLDLTWCHSHINGAWRIRALSCTEHSRCAADEALITPRHDATFTFSSTPSPSATPTQTATETQAQTDTPTETESPSFTASPTPSATPSATPVCMPVNPCASCSGLLCEDWEAYSPVPAELPSAWLQESGSANAITFVAALGGNALFMPSKAIVYNAAVPADLIFEAEVYSGRGVLLARVQPNLLQRYQFVVIPGPTGLVALQSRNQNIVTNLAIGPRHIVNPACPAYRMQFSILGGVMKGYINGVEMVSAVEPGTWAAGNVGLESVGGVFYDNLRLNNIACAPMAPSDGGASALSAKDPSERQAKAPGLLPEGESLIVAPNPVSGGKAELIYRLKAAGKVRVLIFDLAGALASDLNLGEKPAGEHRAAFSTLNWPPGLYYVLLQVDEGFGQVTQAKFKMAVSF